MPERLLATRQDVYDMLESFDELDSAKIRAFFEAHDVNPIGVIDYARLVIHGALSMGNPASNEQAEIVMLALFNAGVVLGLKLADKRGEGNGRPDLRLVPEPPQHD